MKIVSGEPGAGNMGAKVTKPQPNALPPALLSRYTRSR